MQETDDNYRGYSVLKSSPRWLNVCTIHLDLLGEISSDRVGIVWGTVVGVWVCKRVEWV